MRVEHDAARPPRASSPEATAGEELKSLRMARGWTQEKEAKLLAAQTGRAWHQTTIARIEAGTRPLRVNELTDFAELFDVQPAALLRPWSDMPPEAVEAMIAELEPALEKAQALADKAENARLEALNIEARLNLLRRRRDYLKGAKDEGV
jgi:transcriptional regulator with XRE-family HTH domain